MQGWSALVNDGSDIVDWGHFEKSRAELGPGFIKILGYYREDGAKSLAQIEQAMRDKNSVALVIPAHTLKGESRQFGAEGVADVAEKIETTARYAIESGSFPDHLIPDVVELRQRYQKTIALFDKQVSPLAQRSRPQGGFGKRVANQDFGRL